MERGRSGFEGGVEVPTGERKCKEIDGGGQSRSSKVAKAERAGCNGLLSPGVKYMFHLNIIVLGQARLRSKYLSSVKWDTS